MDDKPPLATNPTADTADPVKAEQRLLLALQAANQGLWDWDLQSRQGYFSPSYYAMLGYRPGDFPSDFEGWKVLVHPDDLDTLLADLEELADSGRDLFEHTFRLRHRQGGWRRIIGRGLVAGRDADGRPTRLVGISIDVTEQTLAEDALHESEARFRAIFDNIQEGILIHDIDTGAILATNQRACALFATTESKLLASSMQDLSSGEPPYSQAEAVYWMMLAAAGDPQTFEWQAKDSTGRLFWAEITMRRAVLAGQERLLAVVRDISHRKEQEAELRHNLEQQVQLNKKIEEAQNQLLQSEKMASIGQLAAGVAHELNNPIGFVHSNVNTLEHYLQDLFAIVDAAASDGEGSDATQRLDAVRRLIEEKDYAFVKTDVAELMAESKDGLERVRKIVQDLKDFSRVGDSEWQLADVHVGIDSTLNIVWNELKYKCTVNKVYGDLPKIQCLPSQLNQVFMNLLVNAGQAIKTKGEITIRTGADDESVWIEVADNGSGISKDNLKRIFDPFFTTKPVGKGTGLGLSLSFNIVHKHHGRIDVESEEGKGSTFRITLPIQPPAPALDPGATVVAE